MARDLLTAVEPIKQAYIARFAGDPKAFDILVYRPGEAGVEEITGETDFAGGFDSQDREIDYSLAVGGRALELPSDQPFYMDSDGDASTGHPEPIEMISDVDVPKRSVIQFDEVVGRNPDDSLKTRTVIKYVLGVRSVDRGGFSFPILILIPFEGDTSVLPEL